MLFRVKSSVIILALSSYVSGQPLNATCKRQPAGITEAQLLQIAPNSKTCDPTAKAANECRTAAQAAPLINAAHKQFGINTKGEAAALVSLQVFESGQFKFDRNQAGNPGQGTRNEMNFPFIYQYALDTPSIKDAALNLVPAGTNLNTVTNSTKNDVLNIVLQHDDLSFASAAWFLKRSAATAGTGCSPAIISGLQAGTEKGWEAYITGCVGTTVTDDRRAVYNATLAALN